MFSRKVVINLLVVLVCGLVAISIPIIVRYQQKSAQASTKSKSNHWTLVCEFVGDQEQIDAYLVWRLYQKRGDTIVVDWENIYASISSGNTLTYDTTHLKLTPQGLIYRNVNTPEDYQKLFAKGYSCYITYQGQTCVLILP